MRHPCAPCKTNATPSAATKKKRDGGRPSRARSSTPTTAYLFHLMDACITQGCFDRGLLRLTPRAQAIITEGIGVYATPLLQPTQTSTRTAQGNPVYIYHPTAIARPPVPSDTDIIYFTHASGTQQRTSTVGCASVRIT